ncbi:hypothetical protein EV663_101595 [Rhodovulum bhavnagarense]|uniref:Uncharacterized protein n=1 Tax=Rhodovulum bhavnagarense TaxID=992286 RepID=A0A4R2RM38_9RHOB|nr:hypothetical protein [Rhodovulum bhavnagarense]TCP63327.1 hypothetical protein EV663_101595 [Rhodovulum bhavnagarense]
MRLEQADPRRLIAESYRIEAIRAEECRSIFLDWALGLPVEVNTRRALKRLLAEYSMQAPDHPMTAVLREGLEEAPTPRRRGGASARRN